MQTEKAAKVQPKEVVPAAEDVIMAEPATSEPAAAAADSAATAQVPQGAVTQGQPSCTACMHARVVLHACRSCATCMLELCYYMHSSMRIAACARRVTGGGIGRRLEGVQGGHSIDVWSQCR